MIRRFGVCEYLANCTPPLQVNPDVVLLKDVLRSLYGNGLESRLEGVHFSAQASFKIKVQANFSLLLIDVLLVVVGPRRAGGRGRPDEGRTPTLETTEAPALQKAENGAVVAGVLLEMLA